MQNKTEKYILRKNILIWVLLFIWHFLLLADGQRQELNLGGSASRHCFYDLTPSSQYQISIYTQMQEMEGPSVSITDMTRMYACFYSQKGKIGFKTHSSIMTPSYLSPVPPSSLYPLSAMHLSQLCKMFFLKLPFSQSCFYLSLRR